MQGLELFPPNRVAGLARLAEFLPRAGRDYADDRNHDRGAGKHSNVSGLSPYLRHRLITETEVLSDVVAQHGFEASEKFVQEVLWRGYWRGWLEGRPAVWQRYRQRLDQQLQALDRGGVGVGYRQAVEGKTGIDCLDAWSKELVETGYLHNHARMWFASIWIFTLRLPWELGADFFIRHLVDGDAASNTLSWRWVAGLHTKGKHYLAQRENIHRYSDGRFFPKNLVKTAAPLEEVVVDSVRPLAAGVAIPDGDFGLLLSDDDLGFETMALPWERVKSIGLLATASDRSPQALGTVAAQFAQGAIGDTVERLSASLPQIPVVRLVSKPEDLAASVAQWASTTSCKQLASFWPAAGHVAQKLGPLANDLALENISLQMMRRDYDSRVWPHAQRGFFQLKERIPEILVALGISSAIKVSSSPKKPVIRFR
jgi:deoxyribodipyrimidine photo-lyase